jgi:hypothetical protein
MLRELGYKTFPELILRISPDWEPTPDVVANVKEPEDPYQQAQSMSWLRSFHQQTGSLLFRKSVSVTPTWNQRYSDSGSFRQKAWFWSHQMRSVMSAHAEYAFHGAARALIFDEVWRRLQL